ncbi:MAG TPA: hypothetical protein VF407_06070, partial [Polyangiaceae bacterium]
DRRLELCADALSVRLSGRSATKNALTKLSLLGPLHDLYLDIDVTRAIGLGALPNDLAAGFRSFRGRVAQLPVQAEIERSVREHETALFDSHPSLRERTTAIDALPEGTEFVDEREAVSILSIEREELDAWLTSMVRSTLLLAPSTPLAERPWAQLPDAVFAPELANRSTKLAQHLSPLFPATTTKRGLLREVLARLSVEGPTPFVLEVNPSLRQLRPDMTIPLALLEGGRIVAMLLGGALLEVGATIEPSLGEPCLVFRWNDERVLVSKLATDAMERNDARDALLELVSRLSAV